VNNIQQTSDLQELYLRNLIFLGWVVAIFVTPFAIYSFFQQRYSIVLTAVVLVLISIINSLSIKHKRVILIPYFLWFCIIICELTLLTVTIGIKALLWSYPFVFTIFFVQERRAARIYSFIVYISLIGASSFSSDIELVLRFAVTLFMLILLTDAAVSELIRMEGKLREMTIRDPLTNAHNRRYMNYMMEITIEETRREFGPASIIMLDIDHFKKINDKHGHAKGDVVLIKLVDLLHKRQRRLDYVFRSGGEEFVMILRNTGLQQALSLAENLRVNIEKNELLEGEKITISLGVAEYQAGETEVEWLQHADELLYEAKNSGRNCVRPAVLSELYN